MQSITAACKSHWCIFIASFNFSGIVDVGLVAYLWSNRQSFRREWTWLRAGVLEFQLSWNAYAVHGTRVYTLTWRGRTPAVGLGASTLPSSPPCPISIIARPTRSVCRLLNWLRTACSAFGIADVVFPPSCTRKVIVNLYIASWTTDKVIGCSGVACVDDWSHSLPATQRLSTSAVSHACLYFPATQQHRTLAGSHFPPAGGRRLSWLGWLQVTYRAGLPVRGRSPIPIRRMTVT